MIDVIRLHEAGQSWRQIGAPVHHSGPGCHKFFQKWEKTDKLRRQWGRPRESEETASEIVIRATEEDRRSTLIEMATIAETWREMARRIRHQNGDHYYECVPVPRLSPEAQMTRVTFAQNQVANHDGLPIIFTDESMVAQDLDRGGIWRKRGEILEEGFYEKDHHPLSVMVWGAIGVGFHGPLIRCPSSVNQVSYREILTESRILETLCQRFGPQGFWWQQDNAPAHQPVQRVLAKTYKVLQWPPYSPDLSPIEQMWELVKRKLKGRTFANADALFEAMARAWIETSQQEIDNLCSSFQARCEICAKCRGASLNGRWTEVRRVHHGSP
jgi:hypothetical protein